MFVIECIYVLVLFILYIDHNINNREKISVNPINVNMSKIIGMFTLKATIFYPHAQHCRAYHRRRPISLTLREHKHGPSDAVRRRWHINPRPRLPRQTSCPAAEARPSCSPSEGSDWRPNTSEVREKRVERSSVEPTCLTSKCPNSTTWTFSSTWVNYQFLEV